MGEDGHGKRVENSGWASGGGGTSLRNRQMQSRSQRGGGGKRFENNGNFQTVLAIFGIRSFRLLHLYSSQ